MRGIGIVIVYGRITGQTEDAWLFRQAHLLDRDPPLGDVVHVPKQLARRGRLRWANLDALTLARSKPDVPNGRVGDRRDREAVPLFAAAGTALD